MEDGEDEIEGKVMLPGGWHDLAEVHGSSQTPSVSFFCLIRLKGCGVPTSFRLKGLRVFIYSSHDHLLGFTFGAYSL